MSSLIPGYNYDIFISYRQKDNKHDGWVTEFVENLKGELESTFKEEIGVYFDINPHDGLLETHDVDASLKDKLKCLIFIPIISRTYCDPKSFAWEHEFKAFVEQASEDEYGLKVKLPNGNVAGRILPIQIYELDNEDIKLCESVIEGVLRGIEFIYKSPGVNRPLLPKENNPKENLNHTDYRDQINKVANAIKDIITAIRHYNPQQDEIAQEVYKQVTTPQKNKKTSIIITSVIALALIILGILFLPKLFKPDELEKSIAVLPFTNDSPDTTNVFFMNGIMERITNNLQTIKGLRVIGRNSVEQYRNNKTKSIPEIAKELDVNYIVEGSGQKYGNSFSLVVQLLRAKGKETHLWAKTYDQEIKGTVDIFNIQSQIAQSIASELKTAISPEEKQLIDKTPTENLDAYYAFQRGNDEFSKRARYGFARLSRPNSDALNRAEDLYHQALEYDPEYAQAYVGLAKVYWDKHYGEEFFSENFMDSVLYLANKALSYDNNLAEAYSLRGDYYTAKDDYEKAIKDYEKTININQNYWQAYTGLANLYSTLRDPINTIKNLTKALKLNHDPRERPSLLSNMAFNYGIIGFYDKSKEYYKEKLKLDDDSIRYYGAVANIARFNEEYSEFFQLTKRRHALDPDDNEINAGMATIYYILGQIETAAEWYKKYISGLDTLGTSLVINYMHRVGFAYLVAGQPEKAVEFFELQRNYCEESIRLNTSYAQWSTAYYDLACTYAIMGNKQNAYRNLHIYNDKIGNTEYLGMFWFLKTDPLLESIRNEPEFQEIYHEIEAKYNNTHEKVRKWLKENDML